MPRLAKSNRRDSRRSRGVVPYAERLAPADTSGLASAYVMPTGSGLAIPRLDGVQVEQQLWQGEQAAARLAHSFLEADVADAEDWVTANHNPFTFLKTALERWLAMHRERVIREQFSLDVLLSTSLDRYFAGDSKSTEISRVFLTVEPDSAGYVILGPTLRLLDGIHPRLPVTFLHLFFGALNRWIHVYEYRDALDRVERLRDWYEADREGGDVELPDVELCVPESLKRRPFGRRTLVAILSEMDNPVAQRLLELAIEMDRVSSRHIRPEIDEASRELLIDCGEPVPALLAVFEEHDPIEGCFDEDCQTMLEVTPAPNVIIPFNGETKEGVLIAFATLATVCETLSLASRLITLMRANE